MQSQKTIKKLLYTRREASYLLSISTVTLDKIVQTGALKPTRVGKRVLFPPEVLTQYATQGSVTQ